MNKITGDAGFESQRTWDALKVLGASITHEQQNWGVGVLNYTFAIKAT